MLAGQLSVWVSWPCTLPFLLTKLRATVLKTSTRVKAFSQSMVELSCTMFTRPSKFQALFVCLRACDDDIRCQSINHVVHGEICKLNNRTKEARPEYFTTDDTKVYMKKFRKRSRWRRFAKNLVSLFSRIRPGFQVGYCMEVVVMATFRLRLLVWKETHYEKLSSREGKTHTKPSFISESPRSY